MYTESASAAHRGSFPPERLLDLCQHIPGCMCASVESSVHLVLTYEHTLLYGRRCMHEAVWTSGGEHRLWSQPAWV